MWRTWLLEQTIGSSEALFHLLPRVAGGIHRCLKNCRERHGFGPLIQLC